MKLYTDTAQLQLAYLAEGQLVYKKDNGGFYLIKGAVEDPALDILIANGNYAVLTKITAKDLEVDGIDLSAYAPLDSPDFIGIPTAPTPDAEDDSTQIATTEFVKAQLITGDSVIETGENANGSYRVWSDGYVEQWGQLPQVSFRNRFLTFPVEFSNTEYVFNYLMGMNRTALNDCNYWWRSDLTRTEAGITIVEVSGGSNAASLWTAQGY